mmetsp:Transcript_13369/g.44029  ORF Transcript_13369/g.44029 Transcript_13369/m.44029 type:complete len:202 (-) Transcript_13369:1215-1820(-)
MHRRSHFREQPGRHCDERGKSALRPRTAARGGDDWYRVRRRTRNGALGPTPAMGLRRHPRHGGYAGVGCGRLSLSPRVRQVLSFPARGGGFRSAHQRRRRRRPQEPAGGGEALHALAARAADARAAARNLQRRLPATVPKMKRFYFNDTDLCRAPFGGASEKSGSSAKPMYGRLYASTGASASPAPSLGGAAVETYKASSA